MSSLDTFRFLAENSFDLMCRCDMVTVMEYVSPSSARLLGWAPEEMQGRRVLDFVFAEDLPLLVAAVKRGNSPGTESELTTVRMLRKDGTLCWMEILAKIVRDEAGTPRNAAVIMRDVTERKRLEEQLARMALTDGLTGLANRRAFDQNLADEWEQTLRDGAQMSLLLLDVDRFKQFNDLYGHQVGDDCLRAVARAIEGAVRGTDLPARYGGEEIAVILPGTGEAGAAVLAEAVRLAVLELGISHAGNGEQGGVVTVSVGIATALARSGGTVRMPEGLLLSADLAMYKAKHGGRNRVGTAMVMAQAETRVA